MLFKVEYSSCFGNFLLSDQQNIGVNFLSCFDSTHRNSHKYCKPFQLVITKLKLIFRPPHGNSSSSRVIENLHNLLLIKLKKNLKSQLQKTCCLKYNLQKKLIQ